MARSASRRRTEPGPEGLLGLGTDDPAELHRRIEAGLPFACLERLREALGRSLADTAALVRIPPRTLARRRGEGRLTPEESDRVVRLARLVEQARALFEGDAEAARRWLDAPARGLGGRVPLAFATSEVGAREVERLIGRLEHGVVA